MLRANSSFLRRWHSDEIGAGPRLMAGLFAIANIPSLIFAFATLIGLPVALPGMVLYIYYWSSFRDRLSWSTTRTVWKATLVYNLLLLVGAVAVLLDSLAGWTAWLTVPLLPTLAAGLSLITLRGLKEHQEINHSLVAATPAHEAASSHEPSEPLSLQEWASPEAEIA